MKFQTDQWVIYDPWKDKPALSNPKRAVILYVFKESERSLYDYEIYIDAGKGRYLKVKEKDLYECLPQNIIGN
tara:strand:+ start:315 stop:533 length:219 start_codon:yes stop_codon:yes gene_type:complete